MKYLQLFIFALASISFSGCEQQEGPAEKAGKKIDETVNEVKEGVNEQIKEINESIKESENNAGEPVRPIR